MNTNKILSKIRTKRHALNYSQEYMALLLKMKQSNYNKIENGKVELSIPLLYKIAKILDLNPQELFLNYEVEK
jgi:transcriptional regulator with XRE-family HTH domain